MTVLQMNAEILRNMSIIAEDENLLKRAAKYLRKIKKKKKRYAYTKEEFSNMLDEAEKGPSKRFENISDLDKYISSL